MEDILRTGLVIVLGTAIVGCGSPARQAQSRQTAAASYAEGVTALESRDYSGAVEHLSAALESGWLGYSTIPAYAKRAIANAALGNYDAAHADLDTASQGEGDTAEIHVVRTYVFEKQGKAKEAKAAWYEAKKLDRRAKKIKD